MALPSLAPSPLVYHRSLALSPHYFRPKPRSPIIHIVTSVYRLSVSDDARGLGVGRQLMAHVEAWAVGRGATHVTLTTANAVAGQFYMKLGYSRVGWLGYTKNVVR